MATEWSRTCAECHHSLEDLELLCIEAERVLVYSEIEHRHWTQLVNTVQGDTTGDRMHYHTTVNLYSSCNDAGLAAGRCAYAASRAHLEARLLRKLSRLWCPILAVVRSSSLIPPFTMPKVCYCHLCPIVLLLICAYRILLTSYQINLG
jgi:hypothetical protein